MPVIITSVIRTAERKWSKTGQEHGSIKRKSEHKIRGKAPFIPMKAAQECIKPKILDLSGIK